MARRYWKRGLRWPKRNTTEGSIAHDPVRARNNSTDRGGQGDVENPEGAQEQGKERKNTEHEEGDDDIDGGPGEDGLPEVANVQGEAHEASILARHQHDAAERPEPCKGMEGEDGDNDGKAGKY